jgi:hypothetical protein
MYTHENKQQQYCLRADYKKIFSTSSASCFVLKAIQQEGKGYKQTVRESTDARVKYFFSFHHFEASIQIHTTCCLVVVCFYFNRNRNQQIDFN